MALAWKAGWVNSPQGFESPILRHADQRKRRDGLTESDPAFGLWSRFPSQSGLIGIVVGLWLSPDQAAHSPGDITPDRVGHSGAFQS